MAVMMMFIPVRTMVMLDHENDDITTNSSLIKLMLGDRARLAKLARIHQAAIRGRRVCRPPASIIV